MLMQTVAQSSKWKPKFLYIQQEYRGFMMFTEDTFRRHAEEVLVLAEQLARARKLFKTEGGHLTQAGRAVVLEGERQGFGTGEIASLLDVTPAVVRYHLRQQQRSSHSSSKVAEQLAA
jgi:hypothetical protein